MRISIFNIISAIVFGAMTAICLWAGFYNPVHFLYAGCCALLTVIALFDNSDCKSIIDWLKEKDQSEF